MSTNSASRLSIVTFGFILMLATMPTPTAAQDSSVALGTIVGVVRDSISRSLLVGASVRLDSSKPGTSTDASGRYVLDRVPLGPHLVTVFYLGYVTEQIRVTVQSSQPLLQNFSLLDFENGAETMAKRDIANGNIRILVAGLQINADIPDTSFTRQYGFRYDLSCSVWGYESKYNAVVEKFLDKRNGPGWRLDLEFQWKYLRGLHKK